MASSQNLVSQVIPLLYTQSNHFQLPLLPPLPVMVNDTRPLTHFDMPHVCMPVCKVYCEIGMCKTVPILFQREADIIRQGQPSLETSIAAMR